MTPAAEAEQLSATPAAGAAFLEATLAAQIRAEQALHGGDGTPRRSTRSHDDPVTLFGAGVHSRSGWRDVGAVFDWLATTFTSGSDYRFERLAADAGADLAYTVGLECQRASTPTGEVVNNALRATHVHRREPGVGKIVYRHGEPVPSAASDVAVVLSPEPGRR